MTATTPKTVVINEGLAETLAVDRRFQAVLATCLEAFRMARRQLEPRPGHSGSCQACRAAQDNIRFTSRAQFMRCMTLLPAEKKAELRQLLGAERVEVKLPTSPGRSVTKVL